RGGSCGSAAAPGRAGGWHSSRGRPAPRRSSRDGDRPPRHRVPRRRLRAGRLPGPAAQRRVRQRPWRPAGGGGSFRCRACSLQMGAGGARRAGLSPAGGRHTMPHAGAGLGRRRMPVAGARRAAPVRSSAGGGNRDVRCSRIPAPATGRGHTAAPEEKPPMQQLELKDPAAFASEFLRQTQLQGFGALSKRDLELLVFVLLERDGAIDRNSSNHAAAAQLRVTPAKLRALRRDGYARWRQLVAEPADEALRRILGNVLTEANLRAGSSHVSERSRKEGFLAVRIEHPDDRQQFEQAVLDSGGLPVYERNREVLAVRFDTLVALAERSGFLQPDTEAVVAALRGLAPASQELAELLRKDITRITWADVRNTLNSLGAKAVAGSAEGAVRGLLRVVFPFLP